MQEKTINKPLSGNELQEAIVHATRQALSRDCHMLPHISYPSFSCRGRFELEYQSASGTQRSAVEINVRENEFDPAQPITKEVVEFVQEPKPPNQVRVESGQGVPVMVKTASGRVEEKRAKYSTDHLPAKVPK